MVVNAFYTQIIGAELFYYWESPNIWDFSASNLANYNTTSKGFLSSWIYIIVLVFCVIKAYHIRLTQNNKTCNIISNARCGIENFQKQFIHKFYFVFVELLTPDNTGLNNKFSTQNYNSIGYCCFVILYSIYLSAVIQFWLVATSNNFSIISFITLYYTLLIILINNYQNSTLHFHEKNLCKDCLYSHLFHSCLRFYRA